MENNLNKLEEWILKKRKLIGETIDSCGDVDKESINQADIKYMCRARLVLLEELERYMLNGE